MANSLGRTIEVGEMVVLRKKEIEEKYHDLKWRLVRIRSESFGLDPNTIGQAIFVECPHDGKQFRWSGQRIDKEETEAWQSEHGKFGNRS